MFFEQFTETIIGKSSNELEKRVEFLNKLKEKNPEDEKIKQELKIAQWGLNGEKTIEFELKNANIGMYVLHDINLKYEDLTAQIDFVVITKAGIYFIECKNLIGNVIVDNFGNFIREYEYNGNKIKEGFYSPYRQAERHKEIMKKIWLARHGKIVKALYNTKFDVYHKILVVMANPKNILDVTIAPNEIKNKTIKSDSLVRYLKNDIINTKMSDRFTKKQIYEIAKDFLMINNNSKKDYGQLYEAYTIKNIDEIKSELVKFRKNKALKFSIPEDYIFTDEELKKLLNKLPKTLENLKDNELLSEVKIKFHGQEIIDIINK